MRDDHWDVENDIVYHYLYVYNYSKIIKNYNLKIKKWNNPGRNDNLASDRHSVQWRRGH